MLKCQITVFKNLTDLLQPWTKLDETKFENLVTSRNGSICQIPNSHPYPPRPLDQC